MIAQEEDEEILGPVLKQETQGQVAPTFKQAVAELADADPAVAMRLTEGVCQLNESQQAFDAIPFLQTLQSFQDAGIKGEGLFQAVLSARLP